MAGSEKINLVFYNHFEKTYKNANLIAIKPLREYLKQTKHVFPKNHIRITGKHFMGMNPIRRKLKKLNEKKRIDAIISIGIINNNLGIYKYIKHTLKIPLIIYPIGGDYQKKIDTNYGIAENSILFNNVKQIFNLSDKIIVPGKFMVREINESYGINPHKFALIPNPVNIESYSAKVSFTYKEDYFIYIGRLVEKKGVDILINAFGQAIRNGLNASLIIIGFGNDEAKLKQLAKEQQIQEKVIFLGEVTGLVKVSLLKGAKAFIAPSRREPYGNTVIEAISAEVPVIASKNEGHLDIPVEESGGLYFNNINELAEILLNKTYEKQYAKRSITSFDWAEEKVLGNWEKVINEALLQ